MKRSLSAPCLAEEGDSGSKKCKEEREEESDEPTSREYLQLALARVLELQRQVKDETYSSDATSDLGESDSEEDVMREVLMKVFKDLPGSSPSVSSIINRATQPEDPRIASIIDKKIQLSGYDSCRKIAIDFMNSVVRNTPVARNDAAVDLIGRFERGRYSIIEGRKADHKTGLIVKNNKKLASNSMLDRNPGVDKYAGNDKKRTAFFESGFKGARNLKSRCDVNFFFQNYAGGSKISCFNSRRDYETIEFTKDYEIRVRMLRGLDLHLADKQRDFTARLMRQ